MWTEFDLRLEEPMTLVDIHNAKSQLSGLLDAVAAGSSVTITREGSPVARLVPCEEDIREQRLGFLRGHGTVPADFDDFEAGPIETQFEDK